MNNSKYRGYRRERENPSPETLQEMMKFLADAPSYCATWRENGEGRMTLCAETGNRCFGRTVYEDLHTGGLAVIVSLISGVFLVDLDTFLNAHRFLRTWRRSDDCA